MSRAPRTLAVVDAGGATVSVCLLGRLEGRWRLLGSLAGSAGIAEDGLLRAIVGRIQGFDPKLAADLELDTARAVDIARLTARSRPPSSLLVIGASRRSVGLLEAEALRTGWRVVTACTETHDPREMTELALGRSVGAMLLGAGDPPGPDERAALDDLAALGAAVAGRRPELPILLSGAMRDRRAWRDARAAGLEGTQIIEAPGVGGRRGDAGQLRSALQALLDDPADGRGAVARSIGSIADLLDRRVEYVEVGFDGGVRVMAVPGVAGGDPTVQALVTAEGALVPIEPDDSTVDSVLAWTTGSLDRHRMSDRLRELRARPWEDAAGDGARLRLAAASAAMARMAAVSTEMGAQPAPDLTIVAGGAFATAPASAIALSVADTIRRTGVTQLAWEHARVLGPIGTIEDPAERRALLADLVEDILVPLGTVVVAGGLGLRGAPRRRGAPPVGHLRLEGANAALDRDLATGELAFMDLPPGTAASAHFTFNEAVRFGRRTRHVDVAVTGGLAGLILDLRDVPLHLPERRDRRRTTLADWGALAWPRDDR